MESNSELQIHNLKQDIRTLDMFQYAIKIIINQIYGAFGNKYFYFSNKDIAESITLQGQDLIMYSVKICNHYFMEKFHIDYELHKKLGLDSSKITKINEVVIYVDTDSNYVQFKPVIDAVKCISFPDKKSVIDFIIKVVELRFSKFLDNAFNHYASTYKTENRMVFKLENISDCGIWVAKKNYVYRVYYEDFYRKPKVKAKGLACKKPSHPKFARDIIWDVIDDLLDINHAIIHEIHIIPKLKKYYDQYLTMSVDDISSNVYVNGLTKYALLKSDYKLVDGENGVKYAINIHTNTYHQIETEKKGLYNAEITGEIGDFYLVKGCTSIVKGCLLHNQLIINSNNTKYAKIKSGDKVKSYYAVDVNNPDIDSFSYIPGMYDEKYSYPLDYKYNFYKTVICPINSLLNAIGKQELNIELKRDIKIKIPKTKNDQIPYPFFALNIETLEYYEIPNKFNKYIITDKPIPDYLIHEYNEIISVYKNDLIIISHLELTSYITTRRNAMNKKDNKKIMEMFDVNQTRIYNDAISYLKKHLKFKTTFDDSTKELILFLSKHEKKYTLSFENMHKMKCVENYISHIKDVFSDELNKK